MRTLYEAANAIETHLLQDLLRREGFSPGVHGSFLQGALGDLTASGLVRIVIPEEEYAAAREFVLEWEKRQRLQADPAMFGEEDELEREGDKGSGDEQAPGGRGMPLPKGKAVMVFLCGLALGMVGSTIYFRASVSSRGVDHNGDGVPDEAWTYNSRGHAESAKIDRNLDGKVDAIAKYDGAGNMIEYSSDDDFDGVFESEIRYKAGYAELERVDTDGDGFADLVNTYDRELPVTSEFVNPESGLPLRIEHWKLGKLRYADVDTDKDGDLDVRVFYSSLSEEIKRQPIP